MDAKEYLKKFGYFYRGTYHPSREFCYRTYCRLAKISEAKRQKEREAKEREREAKQKQKKVK